MHENNYIVHLFVLEVYSGKYHLNSVAQWYRFCLNVQSNEGTVSIYLQFRFIFIKFTSKYYDINRLHEHLYFCKSSN